MQSIVLVKRTAPIASSVKYHRVFQVILQDELQKLNFILPAKYTDTLRSVSNLKLIMEINIFMETYT